MAYITKKSALGGSKAKEEYIAKSNIFEKPEYIKKKEKKPEYITKKKEWITKKKKNWITKKSKNIDKFFGDIEF